MPTEHDSIETFSSDFLDDDDDLLATPFFRATLAQQSPASKKAQVNKYLAQVDSEVLEECNLIINNVHHVPADPMNHEHSTVYFHCPICLNPGYKSANKLGYTIQHIKQCASKNLMHPKDVVCLLKQCPKTKQLKFNKQSRGRQGTDKSKAKAKAKESNKKLYELFLYDEPYKQGLIQKRISRWLLTEKLCPKLPDNFEPFLPRLWTMSHLSKHSDEYVLEDFRKYFTGST